MLKAKLLLVVILQILVFAEFAAAQVLNLPQEYQEKDQWCWAATSQSILAYYGVDKTQTEIAAYGTDGQNIWNWTYGSSTSPTRNGVDLILLHFDNIASNHYSNSLTLGTIQNEIDNNRPVVIRWLWSDNTGHILVIKGVQDSTVYLMDPIAGPTINSYGWVLVGGSHTWTHSLLLLDSPTAVDQEHQTLPLKTQLFQNYPNPFNPSTIIKYSVPKSSYVRLQVYNVLGQLVKTLVNELESPGYYKVTFNGSELASGVYIYRLQAGSFAETKKLVLMK